MKNVTFLGPIDYINQAFDYCSDLELIIFPNSSMAVKTFYFITNNMPKVKLSFTCKTIFATSYYSIQRNTNVSISYLNEPNLIITPYCLIMDFNQTVIYEYW